ncbi:MAG: hypothetical protein JW941_09315 [Candidatus Coatesbacteria bacterium]|nr:hypothetical protein [Candidatus Coatesbacteria bacterium]
MNLLQAIEQTSNRILSVFSEHGFNHERILNEFEPDEAYHFYRTRRNKLSSLSVEASRSELQGSGTARSDGDNRKREFPFDVVPLSSGEATDMMRLSVTLEAAIAKRSGIPTTRERLFLWDRERRDACLGNDILARRCSMDDYLWAIYHHLMTRGIRLSIGAALHILDTKRLIAPLYGKHCFASAPGDTSPCYLSPHELPDCNDQAGISARLLFSRVFSELRSQIEGADASQMGGSIG